MKNHTRTVQVGSQKATLLLETHDALTMEQVSKIEEAMYILQRVFQSAD